MQIARNLGSMPYGLPEEYYPIFQSLETEILDNQTVLPPLSNQFLTQLAISSMGTNEKSILQRFQSLSICCVCFLFKSLTSHLP